MAVRQGLDKASGAPLGTRQPPRTLRVPPFLDRPSLRHSHPVDGRTVPCPYFGLLTPVSASPCLPPEPARRVPRSPVSQRRTLRSRELRRPAASCHGKRCGRSSSEQQDAGAELASALAAATRATGARAHRWAGRAPHHPRGPPAASCGGPLPRGLLGAQAQSRVVPHHPSDLMPLSLKAGAGGACIPSLWQDTVAGSASCPPTPLPRPQEPRPPELPAGGELVEGQTALVRPGGEPAGWPGTLRLQPTQPTTWGQL